MLQRVRTDASVRRGQWVALDQVSPAMRQALLLSEDRRFYEHSGVDWQAVSAAAWGNLWNSRTRGASTITMQLAGLLDAKLRRSGGGRSVSQKVGQALAAHERESDWCKDQILEAYLNIVPFRGELVGIDALSRTLFAKAPHGLRQGPRRPHERARDDPGGQSKPLERETSAPITSVGGDMPPRAKEVAPSISRKDAYAGNRKSLSL